eukprot:c16582_g1_i1.p1 GENE.c16582_g1_i1~~c16582_g1_i1.p1  ORF type:complete len:298 (-),score=82.38 c16582_g1_i1:132-1004(-)
MDSGFLLAGKVLDSLAIMLCLIGVAISTYHPLARSDKYHPIRFMFISDIAYSVIHLAQILKMDSLTASFCSYTNYFRVFALYSEICWTVVMLHLSIVFHRSRPKAFRVHLFTWTVAFILSLPPLFDVIFQSSRASEGRCLLSDITTYFFYTGIISFYILAAFFWSRYYKKLVSFHFYHQSPVQARSVRMAWAYLLTFLCLWSIPTLDYLIYIIRQENTPEQEGLDLIAYSLQGIVAFILFVTQIFRAEKDNAVTNPGPHIISNFGTFPDEPEPGTFRASLISNTVESSKS